MVREPLIFTEPGTKCESHQNNQTDCFSTGQPGQLAHDKTILLITVNLSKMSDACSKTIYISRTIKWKKMIKAKVQSSNLFFVRINEITIINKLTIKWEKKHHIISLPQIIYNSNSPLTSFEKTWMLQVLQLL